MVLVALAAALGSAGGRALFGHVTTAATSAFLLDLLHLVLGAAWIGGLFLLGAYATIFRRRGLPDLTFWTMAGRFAKFAFWSFLLVLGSGLVLVAIILGPDVFVEPQRLMETRWGGFIAAKLVLMGAMLLFAAMNRHVVLKAAEAHTTDGGRTDTRRATARAGSGAGAALRPTTLRPSVALEALLGVGILVCAGFLTSLSPTIGAIDVGQEREPFTMTSRSDEFLVTMTLDPSPIAQQMTNMTLLIQERATEAPLTSATRIVVESRLVAPDDPEESGTGNGSEPNDPSGGSDDPEATDFGAERFSATHIGDGVWWVADLIPVRAGHYEVTITIQTPDVYLDEVFLSYHVYAAE